MKKSVKTIKCLVLCMVMALSLVTPKTEAKAASLGSTYVKQVFDADYYYNTYPDVAQAMGNNYNKLYNHYVKFGMNEGRNASAGFNVNTYRNNYDDLDKAFGNDMNSYFKHYVEYGMAEGRSADPGEATVVAYKNGPTANVIGTYSTKFSTKIKRAINVRNAASQINGKLVEPGETFSFLGSILPRTEANGYVVAPIFVNKQISEGLGGGICQVSSTIHAAVKGTDCTIVERHAHSLPVSYIPEGWDATVSSPSLDFRFKNTYDSTIKISITADNGVLSVTLSLL
ncbi:MAG: VanW family protein [Lachnospiraceae bacterium]|nr:VanW family protein [Lachnospiraceae bacterium]